MTLLDNEDSMPPSIEGYTLGVKIGAGAFR